MYSELIGILLGLVNLRVLFGLGLAGGFKGSLSRQAGDSSCAGVAEEEEEEEEGEALRPLARLPSRDLGRDSLASL